jgi:allantoinase
MSNLLIAGGTLVDERTLKRADVLVDNGRVVAILPPEHGQSADATLDASGLHVLPGVVDAHVHFNEPGRTDWEGFLSGSRAAAAGGTTTVCDMPLNSHPPTLDAGALALKRSALAERSLVDYALWGGVVPESIDHVDELRREGVVGVKAFLCDSGLAEYPFLDDFGLLEAMRRCAADGVLLALHAEDAAATHRLADEARAAGRRAPLDWARARPPATEIVAVERALQMAAETGARTHFVHISTAAAARRIAAARSAGQDVTVETCPHYLLLDESDLERLGTFGKCAPPLRARSEVEELWQALLDGAIDYVASDHSPCPPSMKQTDDIWAAWGGLGGVQSLLSALLTEGVHKRGLPLCDVVRLTSAAPARRLGLFPRKGSLEVGSDADIAVVDLDAAWTLRPDHLQTRWPVNPFVGRDFKGAIVSTLVRGTVVWRDASVQVQPGFGQLVTV